MFNNKFWLTLIFILMNLSIYPAYAGIFGDTFGAGIRAMSLGGAFTAVADDYSATFYNPAGLAQERETVVAFNYIQPFHQFKVTYLENGDDVIFHDIRGRVIIDPTKAADGEDLNVNYPVLGVKLDINRMISSLVHIPINIQLGIIASLPSNFNTAFTLHTPPPDSPQFIRFGDELERFMIDIGIGIEVKKDLVYVGFGMMVGLNIDGPVHVKLTIGDEWEDRYLPIQLDIGALGDAATQLGILFTPFDKKLKIGASYMDETCLQVGYLTIEAYVPGSLEMYWDCFTDFLVGYNPRQYRLGFAYLFSDFLFSFDCNYQQWSDYPYTETFRIAYSKDDPNDFLEGYNPGVPDFSDTMNYSVGVEYKYKHNLAFTAGYRYMPSPVPDQSYRVTNYMDFDKNIFSLGLKYGLKKWLEIGGMFQYMMLDDFKVYKNGTEKGYGWVNQKSYKVEGDAFVCGLSVEFIL